MQMDGGIARALLFWLVFSITSIGTALAQPASAENPAEGTITGIVLDGVSGDPIIEAGVEVIGTGHKMRTDLDGKFSVRLAPGTYQLRVFAPLYQGARLQNVVVRAGEATKSSVSLKPEGEASVEVVEVVADASKAAESTQLLQRKKAAVVSDNVSAEVIKQSPDSDAGEIVQRVPAVTVKDDKFINIRGLNERYTSALLNGSRLPSTDPERRVVPMDLFPADFLEALSIIKTYTPDLPGDFSGGLANILLRDYPEKLTASIGLSTAFNTQTTFQEFDTYDGAGAPDQFGFGNDFRALPGIIPGGNIQKPPAAQGQVFGRTFRNTWEVDSRTAPPGHGAHFSIGNSFGPIGASLSATYGADYKRREGEIRRRFIVGSTTDPSGVEILTADDFRYDTSIFETRLGSLFTSAYKPSADHELALRALYNRNSADEVASGDGSNDSVGRLQTKRLRYTTEELAFGQIAGEHRAAWIEVDWRTAYARTTQDQPDGRFDTRNDASGTGTFLFAPVSFGGSRLFGDLEERLTDSAVDLALPFKTALPFSSAWSGYPAKLKFGPAYTYRERDHTLRRFRYRVNSVGQTRLDLTAPTETLLAPENIGPTGFDFLEETQPRDSFSAAQEIAAAYGMFDFPILPGWRDVDGRLLHQLRFIGGIRTEYSYITVDVIDQSGNPSHVTLNDLDPLPGLNVVYSPWEDTNLRIGYSQAVSRPEFRELSPVQYPSPQALESTRGNPLLQSSQIDSIDVRAEWFLSPLEVVSLSGFYKKIDAPIEQLVANEGSNAVFTFDNASDARIAGLEFEARKNLGAFSRWLDKVSFTTNVTYADSNVNVPQAGEGKVTTSSQRSLVGQAPYIVNAAVDYVDPDWGTARLLYNTAGARILAAGANLLPDIFEERRDQLDLVFLTKINPFGTPLNAKVALENLLDDEFTFTQGDRVQREYTTGVKFSLGLSYSY
jgi:hypothetical protein